MWALGCIHTCTSVFLVRLVRTKKENDIFDPGPLCVHTDNFDSKPKDTEPKGIVIRSQSDGRVEWRIFRDGTYRTPQTIDLSVSPSPRTQMSQWQSSISCTGSGTRTSLGFSAIEKHWKIQSSHRFDGVFATKMEAFNPTPNEDKNVCFLVVVHSLSYNFHLLKQNVILCFSKVSLAKAS